MASHCHSTVCAPRGLSKATHVSTQPRKLPLVAGNAAGRLGGKAAALQRHWRQRMDVLVHAEGRSAAGAAADSSAATAAGPRASSVKGPVMLWLKRDLRLDDHPGWHQALAGDASPGVIPVFCFDPARYAHLVLPRGGAEALCRALAALDRSLRRHGSGLVVRIGSWEEQLPGLAAEFGAASVLGEQEVEAAWCQGVAGVAAALPPGVALHQWTAPLCTAQADDFRELKKQNAPMNAPLPAPAKLPQLPAAAAEAAGDGSALLGLNAGQLRQLSADAYRRQLAPSLAALGYGSVEAAATVNAASSSSSSGGGSLASFSEEESSGSSTSGRLIDRLPEPAGNGSSSSAHGGGSSAAAWDAELAAEIAAGEGPVLEALGRYFRHLETRAESSGGSASSGGSGSEEEEPEWQAALADAISAFDLPATPEGCFPALFGRALALGVVSKRRIYAEAASVLQQQPEQPWPASGGPLAQLAWLLTSSGGAAARVKRQRKAAAAAAAAEAKDFHEQMAAGRQGRAAHGATLQHWRWRGLITDYLAAEAPAGKGDPSRPAILLCHGFGAFSEHYRYNVAELAAAGYDVYAPTLPGYGRAEKPVLPYGQDVWRDFLADFALQVVRRPVVVAGNSIGGFISASMAADYPGLAAGLVLLNSAGRLVDGYQPPTEPPVAKPPPPFVVNAVSSGLFSFLEGDVARQLRRVYPVRPERADEWLGGEIARAARDPGALGVFRSVFYLPPPRALNYLVNQKFGGPTLVLQGVKDPLNNALQRARELGKYCPNATVVELNAGHCPHDECSEDVNRHIVQFIEERVLSTQKGSPGQAAQLAATGGAARAQ